MPPCAHNSLLNPLLVRLQGRAGALRGRTFSAPRKWLPGKGRMTIQFGCTYNYATDDQGREPGEQAVAAGVVLLGLYYWVCITGLCRVQARHLRACLRAVRWCGAALLLSCYGVG